MSATGRRWLVTVAIVGAVIAPLLLARTLRGQEAEDTVALPAEEIPPQAPPIDFFLPFPADADALGYLDLIEGPHAVAAEGEFDGPVPLDRYRALTAETRRSAEDIATWAETDNGPAVAAAYAALTAASVAAAGVANAEQEAGLAGIADVGVR